MMRATVSAQSVHYEEGCVEARLDITAPPSTRAGSEASRPAGLT